MIWQNFILTLNKSFQFTGRSRRSEFWGFVLMTIVFGSIASFWDHNVFGNEVLENMLKVAFFLPSLAVSTRRLHDVNRSGWWQLIGLTGIGCFVLLYWYIKDSDLGTNDYGDGPKYGTSDPQNILSDNYADDQIV